MEEGNTWEALMACGHYKLDNLVAILDANGLQGEDRVEKQMDYFPVAEKVRVFKWHVREIDGHNLAEIRDAFSEGRGNKGSPTFIVAKTMKGKGVSFMENVAYWHGSVGISKEQMDIAMRELGG
jgi:transketolase